MRLSASAPLYVIERERLMIAHEDLQEVLSELSTSPSEEVYCSLSSTGCEEVMRGGVSSSDKVVTECWKG
jgi:hypothetical protein